MKEVERKWRLLEPWGPSVDSPCEFISQYYIITTPGELRARRKGEDYFITCKGDGDISRDEWETLVPAWVFNQVVASGVGTGLVSKLRVYSWEGDQKLEIDIFEFRLAGLIMVEAEWLVEDDGDVDAIEAIARAFQLPERFGPAIDVTDDPRYKNKNLARDGIPPL